MDRASIINFLSNEDTQELAPEYLHYGMQGLKPCSVMKEGEVFYAAHSKPEGFCDGAWRTIYQYVFALANGATHFYYNDWIRHPGVAIACCNDGLCPVFFKLEATDEDVNSPFTFSFHLILI
jgi:uncharacterized repeat protein (TIGR04076 family)